MARETHPREDLLRDATALVERVRLRIEGEIEPVLIGFRRDGGASVYFGEEPVLHFNERGELRRAFAENRQFKAERGKWVEGRRATEEGRIRVEFIALDSLGSDRLNRTLGDCFANLRSAIAEDCYVVEGQVPDNCDVVGRVANWLTSLPEELTAERL
jgi:hypothetical protein